MDTDSKPVNGYPYIADWLSSAYWVDMQTMTQDHLFKLSTVEKGQY